jgi:hypothetical protein
VEKVRKYKPVCYANDGGGRTGRAGLNVPGNLPLQPPSGFFFSYSEFAVKMFFSCRDIQ